MANNPPLGSGQRFAQLKNKLTNQQGVTNPGGLAAAIGQNKYGSNKMQKMAAIGRRMQRNKQNGN